MAVEGPLLRRHPVRSQTWVPWLAHGKGKYSKADRAPLDTLTSSIALGVLHNLTDRGAGGIDKTVDRARLVALSQKAGTGNDADLIALWVTTMMWGSSAIYGRNP